MLLVYISRICIGRKDPASRLAFKAGIGATAIVKAYQVSTSDHAIVDGTSPNDFISVKYLTKEHIFERLKECNEGYHGPMATEVKFVVVLFQNRPTGMPQFFTLAGHPQTTNKQNQFSSMVVEACEIHATNDGNAILLNESTDGVSCEV